MSSQKSRKTVVIIPLDGFGHFQPMMNVVQEFIDRKYRVVVMSTRKTCWMHHLVVMGAESVCCVDEQVDKSQADLKKIIKTSTDKDPIESFKKITGPSGYVRLHLMDLHSKHMLIEQKLRSLKPDLILVDNLLSLPCISKMDCPYATLFPSNPLSIYSFFNENCASLMGLAIDEMTPETAQLYDKHWAPIYDMVEDFYEKNGVKICRHDRSRFFQLGLSSPVLNFYLGPRELSYDLTGRFKPLPDAWFHLEHTLRDDPNKEFFVPNCLDGKPGKLIYVSMGTIASGDPSIVNRLLPMLGKSPNRFIISQGPCFDEVETNMFPNMWGDGFLDQAALLKKVDMFITHGGNNSIVEAFYYGVPSLLVMPVLGDQQDSARRIEECGFGKRLNVLTCTEEELLGAIESQLANEEAHERMRKIGERLRTIDYATIAVDKLEELLSTNQADDQARVAA